MHTILVFNCGSSSIKFALVNPESGEQRLHGLIEKIHSDETNMRYVIDNKTRTIALPNADYKHAMHTIIERVNEYTDENQAVTAVGHRVVHGGSHFTESALITKNVLHDINACIPLAPLHNPANILGIETAQALFPDLPHVAVFDTAFHQSMPEIAYRYPLSYDMTEKHHVRRYGFHGTSHYFVTKQAAKLLKKSLNECAFISAHLGNGCSLASVLNGKSLDTTMGFTPLEGLMMGSRSGDIDPGMMAYLCKTLSCDIDELTHKLNTESGLLGVSGLSMDMRDLTKASDDGHARATLAIEMYCYRLAKHIAAALIPLGKLDALIFTGGIGENACNIREKTLSWLKPLDFSIDEKHNQEHGKNNHQIITQGDSKVALLINTNEEWVIAQDTAALMT